MEYKIRELLKNKAMAAVLSVALGIVIIIARRAALDLLVRIIGSLVITGGVALIAVNLIRPNDGSGNMTTVLVMGGLAILAGIILISCAEGIVDFFPTLMGIFLILNGLSHLAVAGTDPDNRIVAVIMGVIIIILGVLIVMHPGFIANAIMIFIGSAFIVNGLFDLFMIKQAN